MEQAVIWRVHIDVKKNVHYNILDFRLNTEY